MQINFGTREVSCKIVYYGPGLGGKTTNLRIVHEKAPEGNRGNLTSIATDGDRTLFFDFLPIELGSVRGMRTKFQLYTVPGQVYYNATRKLVLAGADGVVFVADSQKQKMAENKESLANLAENLREHGADIHEIPIVLQYNKRDLEDIESVETMDAEINTLNAPSFEAVAVSGEGVFPTLRACLKLVLTSLEKKELGAAVEREARVKAARERQKTQATPPAEATSGDRPALPPIPADSTPARTQPAPAHKTPAPSPQGAPEKPRATEPTTAPKTPAPSRAATAAGRTPAETPRAAATPATTAAPAGEGRVDRKPAFIGRRRRGVPVWGIATIIVAVTAAIAVVLWHLDFF